MILEFCTIFCTLCEESEEWMTQWSATETVIHDLCNSRQVIGLQAIKMIIGFTIWSYSTKILI